MMKGLKKGVVIFRKSIANCVVKCLFSYLPGISKGGV